MCFTLTNKLSAIFCGALLSAWLSVMFSSTAVICLRITSTNFPSHVVSGSSVNLTCQYETEGATIYQVKWYKDGEEFYSYLPGKPSRSYPVAGVSLDLEGSGSMSVLLSRLTANSAGSYLCEVTADKTYDTKVAEGAVTVVELPQRAPEVSGDSRKYMESGQMLQINCTSHWSRPAATINWYINNAPPDPRSLVTYADETSSEGLVTRTLGLRLLLRSSHFTSQGIVTVKCTCQIESVYYSSADVVLYNRLQATQTKTSTAGRLEYNLALHLAIAAFVSMQCLTCHR